MKTFEFYLRKVAGRSGRWMTNIYARRHPGPIGRTLVNLFKPLVVLSPINDKWNLKWFIPLWMEALEAPASLPLPKAKRIFIFCTYRIQFTLDLILAVLLAWRGHHVTVGYFPKLQSPTKPPRVPDHPSAKPWLQWALKDVGRLSKNRIEVADLSDVDAPGVPVDEEFIQKQAYSDTVMAVMKETIDSQDPESKHALDYMVDLGRKAQRCARLHFQSHTYDTCVFPNGATFETAHFSHVARSFNIQVNTFEKFAFSRTRSINHDRAVILWDDVKRLWEGRQELGYLQPDILKEAVSAAMHLLNEHKTNSKTHWTWALQTTAPQTYSEIVSQIPQIESRPFVLVGTNVPYDAGYLQLQKLFPSMREWLVETVRFLLEKTDLLIVVRAHPGEASHYGGKERSQDTLLKAGLTSDRLVMLPGETRVNTYALMEAAKFGVVFSSTIGLEFAMLGKSVVLGADPSYGGKGFTLESENRTQYFEKLKALADTPGTCDLDPHLRDQACLFYFLFHLVWQQPYPYDKPSHIAEVPPAVMLRSPTMRDYLPVLDSMAMNTSEFVQHMKEIFGADVAMPRVRSTLRRSMPAVEPTADRLVVLRS